MTTNTQNDESTSIEITTLKESETLVQEERATQSSDNLTLEYAAHLIGEGTKLMAIQKFEEAAELLSLAVEIQVNKLGQYSPTVAPSFYLYAAIEKNGVLGEKADQQKRPIVEPTGSRIAFDEANESDHDLDDVDDDQQECVDDLELAWENLDVARLIYEKENTPDSKQKLADVHLALGDISLESENFEEAINEFERSLNIKLEVCGYRELAEVYFKLGLAFEYNGKDDEAIAQIRNAMDCLNKRIAEIDNCTPSDTKGKGKLEDTGVLREIQELKGFLAELETKIMDIQAVGPSGQVENDSVTNEVKKTIQVNDISTLVRKKRKIEEIETKEINQKSNSDSAVSQDEEKNKTVNLTATESKLENKD